MSTGSPGHSGGGGAEGVAIVDVHGGGRERGKRRERRRSWIRMDASTGSLEVLELTQSELMRRLDLSPRDFRLLDPLLTYQPSCLLSRDRAIVCSIEQVRCIIAADEAFVANSLDPDVVTWVAEVRRRLADRAAAPEDELPFEFVVLETALEAASSSLDSEHEVYPALDVLTTKLSTINLDGLRQMKRRMVPLTRRVQKVRDTIEQLMDHGGDMAEFCLTEKKRMVKASLPVEQDLQGIGHNVLDPSISAPVSPTPAPGTGRFGKGSSFTRSRHSHFKSSESNSCGTEELEMLLASYFMLTDGSLNKLTTLKEFIDDTEDYINIQLDCTRNRLLKFELLLGTAAFVVGMFAVIPGVFGMNFDGVKLYKVRHAFEKTLGITGACSLVIFGCFMWYLKRRMTF